MRPRAGDNVSAVPQERQALGGGDVADPSITRLEPKRAWSLGELRELIEHRELFYFLAWRDIKVRYKQTAFGASWAIIQPFLTMVVFSSFRPVGGHTLGRGAVSALRVRRARFRGRSSRTRSRGGEQPRRDPGPDHEDVPATSHHSRRGGRRRTDRFRDRVLRPLGLVPVTASCPAACCAPLRPARDDARHALGVGLWLAALNVAYRDVRYALAFLVQFWLFATPIAYPSSLVPGTGARCSASIRWPASSRAFAGAAGHEYHTGSAHPGIRRRLARSPRVGVQSTSAASRTASRTSSERGARDRRQGSLQAVSPRRRPARLHDDSREPLGASRQAVRGGPRPGPTTWDRSGRSGMSPSTSSQARSSASSAQRCGQEHAAEDPFANHRSPRAG